MNQTTNYQLNQWESTDRILMADFNSDNSKIDAALKAHSDAIAGKAAQSTVNSLTQTVSAKANQSDLTALTQTVSGKASQADLNSLTQTVDSLADQVGLRGNCQFYITSYVGQGRFGEEHPTSLTFPKTPYLVLIGASDGCMLRLFRGYPYCTSVYDNDVTTGTAVWQEKTVQWYFTAGYNPTQMDSAGVTYQVMALVASDE